MIGLRYKGEYLDVDPGASLSWEMNNLLFSSSDSSKLPGSFSFPFTLPATARNRALLNYPDRIDNAAPFLIEETVTLHNNGLVLFSGILKVTEASVEQIKVYIVVNPLNAVKQTPLNELDLGGDRTFLSEAGLKAHALNTAENPLEYDYVFFPVWNRAYLNDDTGDPRRWFQNWFNSTTQAFEVEHEFPAMMPFVRLEYVLQQIFAGTDYAFENRFQINDELRKLCLYNNKSLWTAEGLGLVINLKNHLSKTGSAAFVRKTVGAFCLGIFYNPWNKVLRLIPLQSIVNAPPKHDWTGRALYTPTVSSSLDQPEILCWKRDDDDGAWAHYDQYPKPASIDGELYSTDLAAAAPGTYYVIDRHAYYSKNSIPRYFFKHTTLGCAPFETGKPAFEAECQALWDASLYGEGQTPIPDGNYTNIPHCRIPGNVEYEFTPEGGGDPQIRQISTEIPDRITFYRGMAPDFDGHLYPLACGLPWDGDGNSVGEYSLRWDGPGGMYDTWWKGWHTMLRQGKNVSMTLRLSIADIIAFNFEDKVRIGNMTYFVKRMRINITPTGLAPVEVDLVSCV